MRESVATVRGPRFSAGARKGARKAPTRRAASDGALRSPAPAKRPSKSRRARVMEARCRAAFNSVLLLMVALTAVGLVRVAVIARAAEMSLSADRLEKSIKSQRAVTDKLEIDRSSLATPSRIEGIASSAMRMGRPASVGYLTISGDPAQAPDAAPPPDADPAVVPRQTALGGGAAATRLREPDSGEFRAGAFEAAAQGVGALFATLADMSVGEAQTLLVGDMALAGSR